MSSSAAEKESAAQRPSGIVPSGEALAPEGARRGGERPSVNVADIDYLALNPRGDAHPMLATVYETWRDGWRSVLRELAATKELRSNDFTQQDLIGVLLIRGACAAVTALRFCDLAQPMWLEDSYFDRWPKDALARLGRSRVCISSNTLISPEWRGARVTPPPISSIERASSIEALAYRSRESSDPTATSPSTSIDLALKSVVFGLVVQQFASSPAEFMVGVSRNDRSMDRLARDYGAQRIGAFDVHGIESDICLFEKARIPEPPPIVEELWSRRSTEGWFPALTAG